MKKTYISSKVEIVRFDVADVIATSGLKLHSFDEKLEDHGSYVDMFG